MHTPEACLGAVPSVGGESLCLNQEEVILEAKHVTRRFRSYRRTDTACQRRCQPEVL